MIRPASNSLKGLIEQIAGNVQHASQPSMLLFGTVTKVNPLVITTDQQHVLPEQFLILTNAVKDHVVDITVKWKTVAETEHIHGGSQMTGNIGAPIGGKTDPTSHLHDITGRKKILIHNALTVGENVILFRTLGGQQYVVIDRVNEATTSGEWNE